MSETKIDYNWADERNISHDDMFVGTDVVAAYTPTWPNIAYIPGVDVSKWQGKMDWAKCKAAGAKWAFIRATVGANYVDPEYESNLAGLSVVGLGQGAYHVVVPRHGGKPVSADANMDNFLKIYEPTVEFPVILDCEMTNGDNPRHITSVIEGCIRILEDSGHKVMIYTGAWWWDGNVMPADKWRKYPLHVANYTAAAEPYMPRDWDVFEFDEKLWAVWQWSADGNNRGAEFGADSDDIDLNRMKVAFWNKYMGEIEEPEPAPLNKVATLQGQLIVGNDIYEGEGVFDLIDE